MEIKQISITHQDAQRLIQRKMDYRLDSLDEDILRAHLMNCTECRRYGETLRDTETVLRETLRKQWNALPLPLQMDNIHAKVEVNRRASTLLPTRSALIGLALMMFVLIAWQSMFSSDANKSSLILLSSASLIPTPMNNSTATNTLQEDCQYLIYRVREGDTLEYIARHFSVPKESILLTNDRLTESLSVDQELMIPICKITPTGTINSPTFTATPIFEPAITTPG